MLIGVSVYLEGNLELSKGKFALPSLRRDISKGDSKVASESGVASSVVAVCNVSKGEPGVAIVSGDASFAIIV